VVMDGCTPTSICDDGGDGGGVDGCTPTNRWWVWTLLEWLHGNMVV
jgi:hypothetical protein